jgi:hypothetical protein
MRTGTSLIVIVTAVAGLMALGFLFWRIPFNGGGGDRATTPEAAAAAGATVSPTEPPLRVEPK